MRCLALFGVLAALVWPPGRAAIGWTLGALRDALAFLTSGPVLTVAALAAAVTATAFLVLTVGPLLRRLARRARRLLRLVVDGHNVRGRPTPTDPAETPPIVAGGGWTTITTSVRRPPEVDDSAWFGPALCEIRDLPETPWRKRR